MSKESTGVFLVAATLNFECIEQGKGNVNRWGNMRWEGRCGFLTGLGIKSGTAGETRNGETSRSACKISLFLTVLDELRAGQCYLLQFASCLAVLGIRL